MKNFLILLASILVLPIYVSAQPCQSESCGNNVSIPPLPTPDCSASCGDGVCSSSLGENTKTCTADCGRDIVCGDYVCSNGENYFNCQFLVNGVIESDCMNMCGDGACQGDMGETTTTCSKDCPAATTSTTSSTLASTTTTTITVISTTTTTVSVTTTTVTIANACSIYEFSTLYDNLGNNEEQNKNFAKMFDLKCFQEQMQKIADVVTKEKGYNYTQREFDDWIYYTLFNAYNYFSKNDFTLDIRLGRNASIKPTRGYIYVNKSLYFDSSCKVIPYDKVKNKVPAECSRTFHVRQSPISLIFDEKLNINDEVYISRFPLDPQNLQGASLWKGSVKAPLIVYDPEHKGEIRSAEQLFGNWTFGGQRVASLISNGDLSKPKPWDHGYQALATLDRNGDNKLSGEELAPLALWFDEGSDGVSTKQEVKKLSEVGVVAIYTKPDTENKDPLTGNIKATLGYEREVAGRITTGSSVDWFTEVAGSQEELFLKSLSHQTHLSKSDKTKSKGISVSNYGSSNVEANKLTGLWMWNFKDSASKDKFGALVLKEEDNGEISGLTILETKVAEEGNSERVQVVGYISGKKIDDNNYAWEIQDESGQPLESNIRLNSSGLSLSGESSIYSSGNGNGLTEVKYSWTANKFLQ
ncbi:MAG: hypothetical protein KBC84_11065 [Proteobacteria bacterium]|nr:hypothetical protein [Pseudomonadota bacterium]